MMDLEGKSAYLLRMIVKNDKFHLFESIKKAVPETGLPKVQQEKLL